MQPEQTENNLVPKDPAETSSQQTLSSRLWNIVPSLNLWGAKATVEEEQTFVDEGDTMATSSDEQKKSGFFKRKKIVQRTKRGVWKSEDSGDETELHVSLACGMQPHPFNVLIVWGCGPCD